MTARTVFGDTGTSRWTSYRAELHVDSLVGGIPKDPDTIHKWLAARLEMGDAELRQVLAETIETMGAEGRADGVEPKDALDRVAAEAVKGNGFKTVDGLLVLEGRNLKAALKEAAAVCYPGTRAWPGLPKTATGTAETRKGLRSWLEERVEVRERYVPLDRTVPDIVGEQRIKHVSTPQGKRSTINVVDIVVDVDLRFTTDVLDDCIPLSLWGELWEYVERGGLGADRARGDGRAGLVAFEKITAPRQDARLYPKVPKVEVAS